MPRKLPNWLLAYEEYTEGTESPPLFHLWVAVGTIAGAAQRKIFMDAGYFQVHSNMYIILVSPPGRSRKTTALRIGKNLLKGAMEYGSEVHFSTQASSVAALVKQFIAIKNKDHQSLTAFSSELGSLLGTSSIEMVDFLVDIYDCNPDWDKQTVQRGLEKIERPWLNVLAATTPQWMGDHLSKTAVEGGFVSRSIFIYEDMRRRVAFPELTEAQKTLQRYLKHDLAEIAKLKGEMKFSPDAKEWYKDWYENKFDGKQDGDYRLGGYYERKHIQLLKVAMALSLAQGDSLILEVNDVQTALHLLEEIEAGMKRAFSSVGKNIYSTDLDRIREQIQHAGKASYKQLLVNNIHAVEKEVFDRLLLSLINMGEVNREGDFYVPANHR